MGSSHPSCGRFAYKGRTLYRCDKSMPSYARIRRSRWSTRQLAHTSTACPRQPAPEALSSTSRRLLNPAIDVYRGQYIPCRKAQRRSWRQITPISACSRNACPNFQFFGSRRRHRVLVDLTHVTILSSA